MLRLLVLDAVAPSAASASVAAASATASVAVASSAVSSTTSVTPAYPSFVGEGVRVADKLRLKLTNSVR